MSDLTPNPQAVEAAKAAMPSSVKPHLPLAISRAEPHIRSQLLTELAEESQRRESLCRAENDKAPEPRTSSFLCGQMDAFEQIAKHCRELAAKEEIDG